MAKYQQNLYDGSSAGYVQYDISPDFGDVLLPGDTFTITGKYYCRDAKTYGLEVFASTSVNGFGPRFGLYQKTVNKGASSTFTVQCTVPANYGANYSDRSVPGYIGFSLLKYADLSGGSMTTMNANQKLNCLKNRIAPVLSNLTVTDTTGAYEHFGGYVGGRSKFSVSAKYETDPLDAKVVPENFLMQVGSIVLSPESLTFENGSVNASFGTVDLHDNFDEIIFGLTDNKGFTGTYNAGMATFYAYTPPTLAVPAGYEALQRYTTEMDDYGAESIKQDDAGEYVWASLAGTIASVNGKNTWALKKAYSEEGDSEAYTFKTVLSGEDGTSFELLNDIDVFPRNEVFSAAKRYTVQFRLEDYFESVTLVYTLDKAGGYMHLTKYGLAVGMRSTADVLHKKFEVAAEYDAHFYGDIYDKDGNKLSGGGQWKTLDISQNANFGTVAGTDYKALYTKAGGLVEISANLYLNAALANNGSVLIATLPEGYRPVETIYSVQQVASKVYRLAIHPNGEISAANYTGSQITTTNRLWLQQNWTN